MDKKEIMFNSTTKSGLHDYFIDLTKVFLTDSDFFESNIKSFDINDINDEDCRHFLAIARDAYLDNGVVYGIKEVREQLIMHQQMNWEQEVEVLDEIAKKAVSPDRVEYVKSEFAHLHLFTAMARLANHIYDSLVRDGVTKGNIGRVYQRLEDDFIKVKSAYSYWKGETDEWDA